MSRALDPASYLARVEVSPPPPSTAPLAATPYLSSAFYAEDEATFVAQAAGVRPTGFYSRYGNPTVRSLEETVAHLEGAEGALATPSGLAALTAAVLSVCRPGDRILAQRALYAGTRSALRRIAELTGTELATFDSNDPDDLSRAIAKGAAICLLETPANPMLTVTDLAAAARLCRAAGVATIVDNTVATPLNQTPLALGCDMVVHSATKTLSGHGDVTGGIVCATEERIEAIWRTTHLFGMAMDPFSAWLTLRGLRTLPLRVTRQNETGLALARRLETHPAVARVYYPGLESHGNHAIAAAQMTGYGGVIAVALSGGAAAAADAMRRFSGLRRSASFGGCATLVVRPEAMWAGLADMEAEPLPEGLIRIGVGLESAEDLWSELAAGLG